MRKTPTVFERDWNGDRSRVVNQVHAGCEWVLAGEGTATRKIDGTCCMVRNAKLYKRRELRKGEAAPVGFERADFDQETGKTVGWLPVGEGPEDRHHREAFDLLDPKDDGTYELIGPKIQGNPEKAERHELVSHRSSQLIFDDVPRTFEALRDWLQHKDIEGIVFHHPDGRMAKIKLRDFGMMRRAVLAT